MPAIWAALTVVLGNLVKSQIGFWIAAGLAAFGLQLAAHEFVLEPGLQAIQDAASGMGADALAWFRYLRGDRFITIVLSAYVVASSFSAIRLMRKAT